MFGWTATSDSSVTINTSAASMPSSNYLYFHRTKHTLRSILPFTARMAATGTIRESEGSANSLDIDALARFAVDHHNSKQNAVLEFKKVSNVKEQVVAGTMYYITLEAAEGGSSKVYEAKVWVKPWMNFKQVEDFKHVGDA